MHTVEIGMSILTHRWLSSLCESRADMRIPGGSHMTKAPARCFELCIPFEHRHVYSALTGEICDYGLYSPAQAANFRAAVPPS